MDTLESRFFPFHRLGLRRNPFGSLTHEEHLAVTVLPANIAEVLAQDCRYIQFSGDSGRGKTTLLLAVRQHFLLKGEHIGFEKLPEGQRYFKTLPDKLDGFALDEAQRLWWPERRRLFRHNGGRRLYITTHEDLSAWFQRYAKPHITLSAADYSTRDHLAQVIQRRLAYFARDNTPGVTIADDAVDHLWQAYGSDVRAVEHFLYEVFQGLHEIRVITADDLLRMKQSRL